MGRDALFGRSSLRAFMSAREEDPHFYLVDARGRILGADGRMHIAGLVGSDGGGVRAARWKTSAGAERAAAKENASLPPERHLSVRFAQHSDRYGDERANRQEEREEPKYAPEQDRLGRDLAPGDRVRFKVYPRGTNEGHIIISPRSMVVMPGGGTLPALAIENDDGTVYALHSRGTTKLR